MAIINNPNATSRKIAPKPAIAPAVKPSISSAVKPAVSTAVKPSISAGVKPGVRPNVVAPRAPVKPAVKPNIIVPRKPAVMPNSAASAGADDVIDEVAIVEEDGDQHGGITHNMPQGERLPLGELLVKHKVLTKEQLTQAETARETEGGELIDQLKKLNFCDDLAVMNAYGKQAGMKVVDLASLEISPEVLEKVQPPMMAETYRIMPIEFDQGNNTLTVAMADPLNFQALDELRFMLNCNIKGVVSNENAVRAAIDKYYSSKGDAAFADLLKQAEGVEMTELSDNDEDVNASELEGMANSAPVIKLLNLVLLSAIRDQAADIHFEPYEDRFRIRYKVDGALLELQSPPRSLAVAIVSRIKVMSNLNIAERRVPQDGKITLNLAGRSVDLRVSTLPTMFGESVVIRILDKTVVSLDINRLGMSEETLATFLDLIGKPNGIVLVTGPTGSGKTTTLYACLNAANDIASKIITTEDPVEYELPGIIQCPIRPDIGVTYAACLRAILRQDPDKILVGEIRDVETAGIAIEASLTGHLVFSTLHTQDAPGTVARLVEMGIEPYLLAATIEAVVAQRLIRCVCTDCKTPYTPSEEELLEIGLSSSEAEGRKFYYGKGCPNCKKIGYRGRNAIYEIMRLNANLRDAIISKKSTEVLRQVAVEAGMATLRRSGILKAFDGITTIEEVVRETLGGDE